MTDPTLAVADMWLTIVSSVADKPEGAALTLTSIVKDLFRYSTTGTINAKTVEGSRNYRQSLLSL